MHWFRRLRARGGALLFIVTLPFLLVASLLEPGDGGGGEGGGDGGQGGAGGEGGAGAGGSGDGGQGGSGDAGGDGNKAGSSFTPPQDQAEFDRMIADRIRRERSKFADYDDMKKKAAQLDELEAANKSELEKAQEKARLAEEAAASATTKAQETLKRSAVLVAATKANAADPNDVYALLSEEHKNALTIGDDGQVSGAEDAVKALLEAKPHLVGKQKTSGSADGGTRAGGGGEKPKTLGEAVAAHYATK